MPALEWWQSFNSHVRQMAAVAPFNGVYNALDHIGDWVVSQPLQKRHLFVFERGRSLKSYVALHSAIAGSVKQGVADAVSVKCLGVLCLDTGKGAIKVGLGDSQIILESDARLNFRRNPPATTSQQWGFSWKADCVERCATWSDILIYDRQWVLPELNLPFWAPEMRACGRVITMISMLPNETLESATAALELYLREQSILEKSSAFDCATGPIRLRDETKTSDGLSAN